MDYYDDSSFDVDSYVDNLGYDLDDCIIADLETQGFNLDDNDFQEEGEE